MNHNILFFFLSFFTLTSSSSFIISDYFRASSSFDGYLNTDSGSTSGSSDSQYLVHDIYITIDNARFSWVLLGQERGCQIKIDFSPKYSGAISLHGASTRFLPLPKKQYNIAFKTKDQIKHNLVLRNTYHDPAFCREKLTHDIIRNCHGYAVQTAHANVYINGEYNGLYQIFEDINFKFLDESFGTHEIDLWYYIRRIFEIQIKTIDSENDEDDEEENEEDKVDEEKEKEKEETYTTSQHEILNLNYDTASQQKVSLYHPLYQVANLSLPIHHLFHYESLVAFFISLKLMNVMDTFYHNYGLARHENDLFLYPILWDADKSLGISSEDHEIGYLGITLPFKVMNRYIYPSPSEFIEGTDEKETEDSLYRNLTLGYMTEQEGQEVKVVVVGEESIEDDTNTNGIISNQSLHEVVNTFGQSLATAVSRDQQKWSRWYCDNRMNFNEAIEEMQHVLEISHWNYRQVLLNTPEQMTEGYWSNRFECDEQYYGKPDLGMIIFLSLIFAFNLFSFLIPNSLLVHEFVSLWEGKGEKVVKGEHEEGKHEDEAEGGEEDHHHLMNNQSLSILWQKYSTSCHEHLRHTEYYLNLFVSLFLLISYLVYGYLDVLDSSEILGIPYMQQIQQYIWIYFIVLMNLSFHIHPHWIRILLWGCVVTVSNIYAIVDLIAFAGADSDAKSASNSRGLTLSLDNTESPRVFILYIWFRVICQAIFMLYSLQIPSLAKVTTDDWDAEYYRHSDNSNSKMKEQEQEGMGVGEVTVDEENQSPYHRHHDTGKGNGHGVTSSADKEGSPAEYEMIPRPHASLSTVQQADSSSLGLREREERLSNQSLLPQQQQQQHELSPTDDELQQEDPATTAPGGVGPSASNSHSTSQLEYKHQMKRFMELNMLIFLAVCVGYVIYLGIIGTLKHTAGEVAFSTIISVIILINIRAVYSCVKWFWLYSYGFDSDTLQLIFSTRDDDVWQLDQIRTMKLHYRQISHYLPFHELNTERKIRAVDGWIKKIAHTYDGLMVFILSTSSFAAGGGDGDGGDDDGSSGGGGDEIAETFSYAYTVSLIYMSFYMITFTSNGPFAWILYGAKARVMDGFLGRENEIFGYMFDKYMLPISAPLLIWLRHSTAAAGGNDEILILMSWYIFMPIIIGDSVAEIVGGTWGKQQIRVWGMGEINRKSWEGTIAMFMSSLFILLVLNIANGLSWKWYFYAILNCFIATMIELWAYRSTDNVCMLIASVLLAVAFTKIL